MAKIVKRLSMQKVLTLESILQILKMNLFH